MTLENIKVLTLPHHTTSTLHRLLPLFALCIACSDLPEQGMEATASTEEEKENSSKKEPGYVQVVAGELYTCALHESGTVACWGTERSFELDDETRRFASLSGGDTRPCALDAEGKSDCSGDSSDAPEWLGDPSFDMLASGSAFSCGILKEDSSIQCWGSNGWDQANAPSGEFSHIDTNHLQSCAVRVNGEVTCWGVYLDGLRGVKATSPTEGRYAQVAVGDDGYACGIESETQEVSCWGMGEYHTKARPLGDEKITKLSMMTYIVCGVTPENKLVCGNTNSQVDFDIPEDYKAIDVAVGDGHYCAVDQDGAISCWGRDDKGQTNVPLDARPQ